MVERVRRFNRTVTERIGVLDDHFLGRGRPLGEARLLWEIGGGAELRELRARLGLDSGYLSRLLASLKAQGLVRVEASRDDRRVRRARLTRAGLSERGVLDRRADELAGALLDSLAPSQRERLVAAMDQVERLVAASMIEIAAEPPDSADAVACIQHYFAELDRRFAGGFAPERSIPADVAELTPPAGVLLVARLRGEAVGCGALKLSPGEPGQIKRMWIAPSVRGAGLGRRMLVELEGRAREAGARRVRLETNSALAEAIQLYRETGYREVPAFNDEPYAHHWFEKELPWRGG
ncbi:MAG TPA: bifunctional helix-turn-helix transcriptional regulator/GNAT family N-acetyltransferase [Kofleriaceae bacterium]|nr:bifunctional helix-turn-helix transcriptional regulator/GNAT family N-acetyltransferase [Kofleriaceae bacterium]